MNNETRELYKRLRDLSLKSYNNNQFTFTNFLSMAELSDFYEQLKLPAANEYALASCGYKVFGGYENAERCIIRFGNPDELMYEHDYPISCIKISPLNKKFSQPLSHRDYLGSLMNLGIERNNLGDLLIKDIDCYCFSLNRQADTICTELTRINHTSVMCTICDTLPNEIFTTQYEACTIQVNAPRIDSVAAKLTKLSRSKATELFLNKKVFINGRCMENESHMLKEGDIFSIRGFGKFKFERLGGKTKKGNQILEILIYK